MIRISATLEIDEREVEERFIQASGPGGQNVNKVATAVQLRFDVRGLPEEVCARLKPLAGRRLSRDGVLVINARRYRTQERNRQDALARLTELLGRAAEAPRKRRPTRPTQASRQRRLDAKAQRSAIKRERGRPIED